MSSSPLFTPIEAFCVQAETTVRIAPERQEILKDLARYIAERRAAGEAARMSFICTHNARRSFFSQVWMAVAASRYGLDHVRTYSGGTEVTRLHPNVAASLSRTGFDVTADQHNPANTNPHFAIRFGEHHAIPAFSKRFDDPHNPLSHFCAVMVCTSADAACPFVPGAEKRVLLPFTDPKSGDGTPQVNAVYDASSLEIAAHMLYAARLAALS